MNRRHVCPHIKAGSVRFGDDDQPCELSEYSKQFQTHTIERRQPYKPEVKSVSNQGEIDSNTTHKLVSLSLSYNVEF